MASFDKPARPAAPIETPRPDYISEEKLEHREAEAERPTVTIPRGTFIQRDPWKGIR